MSITSLIRIGLPFAANNLLQALVASDQITEAEAICRQFKAFTMPDTPKYVYADGELNLLIAMGEVELLDESVRLLSPSTAKLELARYQYALGDALRRTRNMAEARVQLQNAVSLADLSGAVRESARQQLRMLGLARSPPENGEWRTLLLAVCPIARSRKACS